MSAMIMRSCRVRSAVLLLLPAALALPAVSCSRKKEPTAGPGAETTRLEMPAASRFADRLRRDAYPAVKAPYPAPTLRWDFSGDRVFEYTYRQEVANKTAFDAGVKDMGMSEQNMSASGKLLMKSKGDRTADLVLQDLKMKITMQSGQDGEPRTMEQAAPTSAIQGVGEDGSMAPCAVQQDLLMQAIFPLPAKEDLAVGESVEKAMQLPFNAMGSLLQVKGRSRVTLAGYVDIKGRTCAQLETDIDIAQLDVPPEVAGTYACAVKGSAVFYFDVASRCFVSGSVAMLMTTEMDAPTPAVRVDGRQMPDAPPRTSMSMFSDNLIELALVE